MAVIGTADVDVRGRTDKFTGDVEKGVRGSAGKLAGIGTGLVAALGVGALVKSIAGIGIAYGDVMNTFQSVTHATNAQLALVGDKAKELGNDLTLPATSASDAAGAMLELSKAGFTVQESMDAALGTLRLSSAAQIDGAAAAQIQGAALNQFGLAAKDATHVSDVLANTANAAAGEITDVALALSYVGPVAKSMSISIEDTSTAIGVLANNGILGEKAGTALRGTLASLANPSKQAASALKVLNIEAFDQQGKFVGLRSITDQLAHAKKGLTEQEFAGAAAAAFGRENLAGINALATAGVGAFDKMKTSVERAGGAQEVAAAKSKGLGGALRALQSQAETYSLNIYGAIAPGVEKAVRYVSDNLPKVIDVAGGVASQLGTALGGAFDGVGEKVSAALGGINIDFSALADKVTAGGGQIVDALQKAVQTGDFTGLGSALGDGLGQALSAGAGLAARLTAGLGGLIKSIDFPGLALEFGRQAPTVLLGFATGLLNFDVGSLLGFIGDHLLEVIIGVITIAFAPAKVVGLVTKIPFVGPLIGALLRGGTKLLRPIVDFAGEILGSVGRGILDGIRKVFPGIGSSFGAALQILPTRLGLVALRAAEIARSIPGRILDGLKALAGLLGRLAGEAIGRFLAPFRDALGLLRDAGSKILDGLVGGLISRFPRIAATLINVENAVKGAIQNPLGFLSGIGSSIVDGLVNGIRSGIGRVTDAARALIDHLPGAVKKILGIGSPSKVFADIGGNIADGLVAGLDGGGSQVEQAVRRLALRASDAGVGAFGLSGADMAAAISRVTATDVDKALATRNDAVTAHGPAAIADRAAQVNADAATRQLAAFQSRADGAATAVASLADQIRAEQLRQREANATQQEAARVLGDRAAAARNARKQNAADLEAQARDAQRSVQQQSAASAVLVAQLGQQKDAAQEAADAADERVKNYKQSADEYVATAKSTADELLRINTDLAKAQSDLADAVRRDQVAAATKMLDAISSQVDALVAKANGLKQAFSGGVLQGTGLGDVYQQVQAATAASVNDALKATQSASQDVSKAQDELAKATDKYTAALVKQQAVIDQADADAAARRLSLQDATAARVAAEAELERARSVATDGAAASPFELAQLKGAYDLAKQARDAEAAAQDKASAADAKAAEEHAQLIDGLDAVTAAQETLAAANAAAEQATRAYAQAQAATGTVVQQVIDVLKQRLTDAAAFSADLGRLAGLGLNSELLTQLAALGPEAGAALAGAIEAAGPPSIVQITALTDGINATALTGMDQLVVSLFGSGADALSALVAGLQSQFPELDSTVAALQAKLAQIASAQAAVAAPPPIPAAAAAAAVTGAGSAGGVFGGPFKRFGGPVSIDARTNLVANGASPQEVTAQMDQVLAQRNSELVGLLKQGVR